MALLLALTYPTISSASAYSSTSLGSVERSVKKARLRTPQSAMAGRISSPHSPPSHSTRLVLHCARKRSFAML